ncbi:MAG: nucleotidyltransferase [Calditrichaeota bacterium]|nr:nucleotidyltransferase [Calditrichota bacterium]MCB9366029.1 nucleotidyltransferase [Calditrichota bacterium]MCB9391845.1 nucleotidyltransferase [Calditrichota bacterium]
MEIYQDFKELADVLNAHSVEYLIVGAHALARLGVVRNTSDIDIWVRPTLQNGVNVVKALNEFGFGFLELKPEEFTDEKFIVQLGNAPVRIDIMTSITGVTWDEAVAGRSAGKLGDTETYFLGRGQFVANKRATGRPKDIADLDSIGELK